MNCIVRQPFDEILQQNIGSIYWQPLTIASRTQISEKKSIPYLKAHEEDKMEAPWKNQCAVELIRML